MEKTKETVERHYRKYLRIEADEIELKSFLKRYSKGLSLDSILQEINP